MRKLSITAIAILMLGAALTGCQPAETPQTDSRAQTTASTTTTSETNKGDSYDGSLAESQLTSEGTPETGESVPQGTISVADRKPKDGEEVAIMETDAGTIVLMFFPDKAPKHVENFKSLAKKGFYNGTKFHRIIPGFMIQGGDPNTKSGDPMTWGTGNPGHQVDAEFNDVHHARGVLSMARSSDPNSAGSQFFIMHRSYPSLDHQYSAFGKVVEGIEVVDKIVEAPRGAQDRPNNPVAIKSLKIEKWPIKK